MKPTKLHGFKGDREGKGVSFRKGNFKKNFKGTEWFKTWVIEGWQSRQRGFFWKRYKIKQRQLELNLICLSQTPNSCFILLPSSPGLDLSQELEFSCCFPRASLELCRCVPMHGTTPALSHHQHVGLTAEPSSSWLFFSPVFGLLGSKSSGSNRSTSETSRRAAGREKERSKSGGSGSESEPGARRERPLSQLSQRSASDRSHQSHHSYGPPGLPPLYSLPKLGSKGLGSSGPPGAPPVRELSAVPPELTASRQSFQKAMGNPCEFFVDIMWEEVPSKDSAFWGFFWFLWGFFGGVGCGMLGWKRLGCLACHTFLFASVSQKREKKSTKLNKKKKKNTNTPLLKLLKWTTKSPGIVKSTASFCSVCFFSPAHLVLDCEWLVYVHILMSFGHCGTYFSGISVSFWADWRTGISHDF